MSTLNFTFVNPDLSTRFGPRLARLQFKRPSDAEAQTILTPALITTTSRGIVPHLSRDHVKLTPSIGWTQVHFETFLERTPPVPTLLKGPHPLHTFLGYEPQNQIVALSLRDPRDGQEMPANTKDFVTCRCVRGVRKVTPDAWRSYVLACQPDVVTALADFPFTPPPYSQKRTMKSLERTTAWLADLLRPLGPHESGTRPHVLVALPGGVEHRARRAFADGLTEPLYGKDLELISPFKTLDEGVAGYVFDLVPLRLQLSVSKPTALKEEDSELVPAHDIAILLKTSLEPLPITKPRIAHSTRTPHEILRLIRDVGIDLFDARFAQHAADIGVALDFNFPVQEDGSLVGEQTRCSPPRKRGNGREDLGHNLFSVDYAHSHSRLAASFVGAAASNASNSRLPVCLCAACSPRSYPSWIRHSEVDVAPNEPTVYQPPFTRAYIHHLLHTHEMSSHTLLAMHNLTVMDAFFAGIRDVLGQPEGAAAFSKEVDRFCAMYDEDPVVFEEAQSEWAAVERARGKGRLQREKSESTTPLGTSDL